MSVLVSVLAAAAVQQISALTQQIETIAQGARGHVGVAAVVIETGESVSLHGLDEFPMQSVYKFPICMAILAKVDRGEFSLDQTIRITRSDAPPQPVYSPLRD